MGVSCRTIRRWKANFERTGYDAFIDQRCKHPSPKPVAVAVVQAVLRLYREHDADPARPDSELRANRANGVRFRRNRTRSFGTQLVQRSSST
jgi:transposase